MSDFDTGHTSSSRCGGRPWSWIRRSVARHSAPRATRIEFDGHRARGDLNAGGGAAAPKRILVNGPGDFWALCLASLCPALMCPAALKSCCSLLCTGIVLSLRPGLSAGGAHTHRVCWCVRDGVCECARSERYTEKCFYFLLRFYCFTFAYCRPAGLFVKSNERRIPRVVDAVGFWRKGW